MIRTITPWGARVDDREHRWIGDDYTSREPLALGHPKRAKADPRQGGVCSTCHTVTSLTGKCVECDETATDLPTFDRPVVKAREQARRDVVAESVIDANRELVKAVRRAYPMGYGLAKQVAAMLHTVGITTPVEFADAVREHGEAELNSLVYAVFAREGARV